MPQTQSLGDMLKLGDLPLEQKEQISDAIKYSAEHEGELYTQVSRAKLDENKTSMTFIRSYLPKIDKNSDRYHNGLVEGVTPDAEQINEAEFSVSVMENGWYFKFTNKAVNHSWLDVKARCSKFLSNIFKTYHDEKIADAYLTSANVVTGFDPLKYQDLQRLGTIIYKNGGTGKIVFKSAPEVIDAMVAHYKDILEGSDKNEAIISGEVGRVADITLVKSRLQAFEAKDGNYPFICYSTNQSGEYPVTICAYDNMAEQIILTPLGGLGDDPLKQRGAIGLYVDGHGFYVSDDSVAIRGDIATSTLTTLSTVTGANLGANLMFDDARRSNLGATGSAREIIPEFDYTTVKKGATLTLKATRHDGSEWAIPSEVTAVSGNTGVATVEGATLTAKAVGVTTVVLTSVANANVRTVVTVEVVA
jgi:hypothetical protein